MKQHITPEQLNELNKPLKKKLMGLIDNIEMHNVLKQNPHVAMTFWHSDENYLLSIGQMIEFLDKHDKQGLLDALDVAFNRTNVQFNNNIEPVDVLWSWVKAVLNEN